MEMLLRVVLCLMHQVFAFHLLNFSFDVLRFVWFLFLKIKLFSVFVFMFL